MLSNGNNGYRVVNVVAPWWVPPKIVVTAGDVRKYCRKLKWRRLVITEDALHEIRKFKKNNSSVSKYSAARIGLIIGLTKIVHEGMVNLKRDQRVDKIVDSVVPSGSSWKDFVKEEGLVEEVKDVTNDTTYDPWRSMVEKASEEGVVGRVVLRTEDGETVIVSFGAPSVISPAYEEVKQKKVKVVKNETNVPMKKIVEVLSVGFKVEE